MVKELPHKNKIIIAIVIIAIGIIKEKNFSSQPFVYEYKMVNDYSKNNFEKTKIQETKAFKPFKITLSTGKIQTTTKCYQLQEHEQNIRRLGIIQENGTHDGQQAYNHLEFEDKAEETTALISYWTNLIT